VRARQHAGWRAHRACRSRRDIETRSLPNLLVATPRDFTFYVADPISSIRARSFALRSVQRSPIITLRILLSPYLNLATHVDRLGRDCRRDRSP
jgi:hypothetical protein